jgi:hypothetical protein
MNTQIIENNKLLAEFMGCYQNNEGFWGFENTPNHKKWNTDRFLDCTQYDTDWNWLMQVVQKIESLGYWVNRITGDVWIQDDYGRDIIDNTLHQGGIEATYNACVSFVQWHNNQNK